MSVQFVFTDSCSFSSFSCKTWLSWLFAVLDVDYSPTGKEFVTASFDRSLRIFDQESKFSREVYHTKRMFIARCVRWSKDNKYIYNGSDETNVRVWKSRPAEKIGAVSIPVLKY